jgi:hypothetical protein
LKAKVIAWRSVAASQKKAARWIGKDAEAARAGIDAEPHAPCGRSRLVLAAAPPTPWNRLQGLARFDLDRGGAEGHVRRRREGTAAASLKRKRWLPRSTKRHPVHPTRTSAGRGTTRTDRDARGRRAPAYHQLHIDLNESNLELLEVRGLGQSLVRADALAHRQTAGSNTSRRSVSLVDGLDAPEPDAARNNGSHAA